MPSAEKRPWPPAAFRTPTCMPWTGASTSTATTKPRSGAAVVSPLAGWQADGLELSDSPRNARRSPPKQRNAICDPAQGHRHGALTCSGKPSQKTLGSGMNRSASCYWRTHPRRKEVVKSSDLFGWSDGPISITFLCGDTPTIPANRT